MKFLLVLVILAIIVAIVVVVRKARKNARKPVSTQDRIVANVQETMTSYRTDQNTRPVTQRTKPVIEKPVRPINTTKRSNRDYDDSETSVGYFTEDTGSTAYGYETPTYTEPTRETYSAPEPVRYEAPSYTPPESSSPTSNNSSDSPSPSPSSSD